MTEKKLWNCIWWVSLSFLSSSHCCCFTCLKPQKNWHYLLSAAVTAHFLCRGENGSRFRSSEWIKINSSNQWIITPSETPAATSGWVAQPCCSLSGANHKNRENMNSGWLSDQWKMYRCPLQDHKAGKRFQFIRRACCSCSELNDFSLFLSLKSWITHESLSHRIFIKHGHKLHHWWKKFNLLTGHAPPPPNDPSMGRM